jgi:hypothetical protein
MENVHLKQQLQEVQKEKKSLNEAFERLKTDLKWQEKDGASVAYKEHKEADHTIKTINNHHHDHQK